MSPPSYDTVVGILSIMSVKVWREGFRSITPALNLSGGKMSGAAASSPGGSHRIVRRSVFATLSLSLSL